MKEQKTSELQEAEKKLVKAIAFSVSIAKTAFIEKKRKSTSLTKKYNKFQLRVAKSLKLELDAEHEYSYAYRIEYKTSTKALRQDDILLNSDGRAFIVLQVMPKMALIVTVKPSVDKPSIYGTFRVLVRARTKK